MEKAKESVIKYIRACLVSTKGRMQLRALEIDYRTIVGERIPYAKFGFRSLEEFIQSEPTLILTVINGEKFVDAKVIQESAHISEMVAVQKNDKRKKLRQFNRTSYHSRPATTSPWRPKFMGHYHKKYQASTRPVHQFVTYKPPAVPSKIVVPEQPQQHVRNVQRQNSQLNSRLNVAASTSAAATDNNRRVYGTDHYNSVLPASSSSSRKKKEDETPKVSSSRQRISQKMSEMNLDRDSGNSSPTADFTRSVVGVPQPQLPIAVQNSIALQQPLLQPIINHSTLTKKVPEFVRTGDPKADLKKFVEYYKLDEPEISTKHVKTKQNRLYTCRIKIGKDSFNSYPREFNSAAAAEVYCSSEALDHLIAKFGKRKSLLLSNNKDILERIPPLLEKHQHGIWAWQLKLDYADKYDEQLPCDWFTVIDSSPYIQIEKCSDDYILRHCEPGEVLQKEQKWKQLMNLSDVSVPSNTVSFVEDGKLYAQVTYVMAANEIWCRQCGTEECDLFNQMEYDMEEFYKVHKDSLRAEKITTDGYYVAEIDGYWYRIRVIATIDGAVSCFLIDYGDEMTIAVDKIYTLKREFASSQAQAFVCRLVGLEELYEISANSRVLQGLLEAEVTLELASEDVVKKAIIPVYMYNIETGQSINQELIPQLTIESALPVLQNETITEVFVSNIESNGDIYVQVRSHGYYSLQSLLKDLETQIAKDPPTHLIAPVTKSNSAGKLYYGKYKLDGHWYRIELIDWAPNEELAQIYFVDYGHTDVIKVKEDILYPLETLSDILNQYPPQAVQVKMAIDEIPADFVTLARKVMPDNHPVLLKVIREEQNERYAEFFKRNEGGLFCINKSITMEAEMKKGGSKNKSPRRNFSHIEGAHNKNVPSGGKLNPPKIPEKQEYFEVHVPFAVNPYNFFVQPLESRGKLHQMMENLQERYKNVLYSPLTVDQIGPGNIYASKFDDGNWYRTSVIKVIHSGSISVFYCDFGYYSNLTVQQLIPLDIEFLELPYQALKAKLYSVKPKQSKWTMEDCDFFKEMVEKKPFYSVVIDIEKDELYESDLVLQLVLIDTSSSEDDIYIGTELIKKGIAVEVNNEDK